MSPEMSEHELRSAAEAGDRAAMAELAHLLTADGRAAEATYWTSRRNESAWAEAAVPIGGRRYPPLVLLATVLVGVLGALAVALVVLMYVHAAGTDDELLVPVLVMLSIFPGAVAVALLSAAVGMLRGSAAAAQRARGVTASVCGLAVCGAGWLVFSAVASGESGLFVLQVVLLGAAVVTPLLGLTALLTRCIPRLAVAWRSTQDTP